MSRRRLLFGVALAALLFVGAGCSAFGGGVDRTELNRSAEYDWNTSATGSVVVEGDHYRAVYEITNGSTVKVFQRDALGSAETVEVSAVQFRYPNGTVVNASRVDVSVSDSRVVIEPPAERGKLAFTAPADSKYVSLPVTVEGSYEVVLPPGMRVGTILFGEVRPGGFRTSIDDENRVHVRWPQLSGETIVVRAYLARDLYVFGGLVGLLVVATLVGLLYFRLQIRRLEEDREEAGLDVDVTQDDDSGGPPLQ